QRKTMEEQRRLLDQEGTALQEQESRAQAIVTALTEEKEREKIFWQQAQRYKEATRADQEQSRQAMAKSQQEQSERRRQVAMLQTRLAQGASEQEKWETVWKDYHPPAGIVSYETAADAQAAKKRWHDLEKAKAALPDYASGSLALFRRLKDQADDLYAQRRDVLQARDEVAHTIEELDKEMTTRLDDASKRIEQAFKETYQGLMGGGMAELRFIDQPDRGIELWVTPPGKRPQVVSLLSGGEKALAGIAWLLALLRIHPTPFVVFDEVEASLDEVNARRLAQFVAKMRHLAQFIIITHHKSTMEIADVLWGVTQTGQGQSQVVSVAMESAAAVKA
ncbi:MAG: AAA family ATPase, partial [Firmicutes bacterium]|nr:AAA family ATPase [Bacillota bacterium]